MTVPIVLEEAGDGAWRSVAVVSTAFPGGRARRESWSGVPADSICDTIQFFTPDDGPTGYPSDTVSSVLRNRLAHAVSARIHRRSWQYDSSTEYERMIVRATSTLTGDREADGSRARARSSVPRGGRGQPRRTVHLVPGIQGGRVHLMLIRSLFDNATGEPARELRSLAHRVGLPA
jgi:hypothetical protein